MSPGTRVLVVTVVHDPRDARIAHRQIPAMLDAGLSVTYAAPFTAFAAAAPDGAVAVDLPRASGRRRLAALRAARAVLVELGPRHDVVLLHDPELLVAVPRGLAAPVVWDVHEDTAQALGMKAWLPGALRRPAASAVRRAERRAEQRHGILLAEDAYASRFRLAHPVVPNTTAVPAAVPPPGTDRVVYLGAVTRARGALEIAEVARLLSGRITVEVMGPVAPDVAAELDRASAESGLVLHGFVPNSTAVERLEGSLAGLSLLHDEPNYRHSMPTKIVEYMAHGVPVVSTPLPLAQSLLEQSGAGLLVPFGDAAAAADAVVRIAEDDALRTGMGAAGHRFAQERFDWRTQAPLFVEALLAQAGSARR